MREMRQKEITKNMTDILSIYMLTLILLYLKNEKKIQREKNCDEIDLYKSLMFPMFNPNYSCSFHFISTEKKWKKNRATNGNEEWRRE